MSLKEIISTDTSIKTSLGFIIAVIVGISGIITASSLQTYEIKSLKERRTEDYKEVQALRHSLQQVQVDLKDLSVNIKLLREAYEREVELHKRIR